MKHTFNPERLTSARRYRAMTVLELETATSISRYRLSKFERGQLEPESDELFKLVDVLKFPWKYFYEKDNIEQKIGNTFFC